MNNPLRTRPRFRAEPSAGPVGPRRLVARQGDRASLILAIAGLAMAAAPTALVPTALAASEAPPPASAAPGRMPTIQAWVDAPFVTPDAPPGGILEAGITFWDTHTHDFAAMSSVYAEMRPATGDAAPTAGTIQADFPGHIVVDFVVPEGGPGDIEVGVRGDQTCTTDGTCTEVRTLFAIAGTGPPPEAAPEALISATFHPFVGDVVVGRATPVALDVLPRGLWQQDALQLPEHLLVVASHPGGPELASAEVRQEGLPGKPFTGRLTIPETGDVTLAVVIPGDGGANRPVPGATTQVNVIEGGRRESVAPAPSDAAAPVPGPATTGGGIPTIAWIVGIGAVVVLVGLVARRVLADL